MPHKLTQIAALGVLHHDVHFVIRLVNERLLELDDIVVFQVSQLNGLLRDFFLVFG